MNDTFNKLIRLFNSKKIRYRLMNHSSEGRSHEISQIRGNDPFQAMKALVISVSGGPNGRRNVLAVIPGCLRLNMHSLHKSLGSKKGSFASPEKVLELTGCVPGAIPPFSFHKLLELIVDKRCATNEEIVFNAGCLNKSIFMKFSDYKDLTNASFVDISDSMT